MKKLIDLLLLCSYLSSKPQPSIDLQMAVKDHSTKVYTQT